jgi:hypothetical protein
MMRKELDPLGADVTTPPPPSLITEPVFYNPRFDQMPLEIEGGPSEEYLQANRDRAALMAELIQALHDREQAEKLWQADKRDEALAILQKNPNVGLEYRVLADGKVVRSGSYFGKDAADFLIGLISPQSNASAHVALVGGDSLGGGGETASSQKNCATPNSLVEAFKADFEAQWDRTRQSKQENGTLIFYELQTNSYPTVKLSEGRHIQYRHTSEPGLPESRAETRKALADFAKAGRNVYFLAIFHTHPDYPGGTSQSGNSSGGDNQFQLDFGNPLGIIRTSKGYSFYSNGRTFWPKDTKANECVWTLNHQK